MILIATSPCWTADCERVLNSAASELGEEGGISKCVIASAARAIDAPPPAALETSDIQAPLILVACVPAFAGMTLNLGTKRQIRNTSAP